jgi:hypothetical protein
VVFRWLCQLKVAPYSYDWIDNWGRRSPRDLTPGAENLEAGQAFLVGRIVEFEPDRHITGVTGANATLLFGHLAISYVVRPAGPDRCRLLAKLNATAAGGWQRVRRLLLAWGDLLMMRKQLLTIKALSER